MRCFAGVSRGCGWQHLAAWTNLVAFYIIGMPLALLFGFKLGFHDKVRTLFIFENMVIRYTIVRIIFIVFLSFSLFTI